MLYWLIFLFTVVPAVELWLLLTIAHKWLGLANTVTLILVTGIVGAAMARHQGLAAMRRIREALAAGRMPGDEVLHGLATLVGGVLLVTPGLLTDLTGFLLLIPQTRALAVKLLRRWARGKLDFNVSVGGIPMPGMGRGPEVRDVGEARVVRSEPLDADSEGG